MRIELVGFAAVVMAAIACSEGADAPAGGDTPQAAAIERGRRIYENVCIACHNADPTLPGSLGPQLAGASRELLEARVVRGEYPPGYTPLRPGQAMPRFEYLKDHIDDLAAYLQQH